MTEQNYTAARLKDLSERAYARNYYTFSRFLGLEEQNILHSEKIRVKYLWGGYDNAERVMACFGDCGYEPEFPIAYVSVTPRNAKFAGEMTHRDFLGALMSLGISRELIGDIITDNTAACVICKEEISDFICENLLKVRHTDVNCICVSEIPDMISAKPERKSITVSSLRCDNIISAVYGISREKSKELFSRELVFLNGVLCSASVVLDENDVLSVRGKGRIIFEGTERKTKKDKFLINIKVFK